MRKHILFILENNAFPFDARVRPEALTAKRYGFEVSIISTVNELAKKHYERYDDIEIYRHRCASKAKGKLGFILEYMNAMFWEFWLSLKIFRKKRFHIIHAANPPDHIFLIALFFKLFGVKFIFDHHDLTPELYLAHFSGRRDTIFRILTLLEKLSCRFANAIISANKSYQRIVTQRHKISSKKIFVVRNDPIVNDDFFRITDKNIEKKGKKVILFLGGINPQDGVDVLLKSLHYLVNDLQEKNFICNIVGGGESLETVKQMAKELQLEQYVNFIGYVTEKKSVKQHLYLSDICVEPAPENHLNRHSTFIKVMEYMSAGKPIVAFDLKETRYSTNQKAILVESNDFKGFAEGIKKLIDKPHLRRELGKEGQKRIREKLNWRNSSKNLLKAYESINMKI